MITQMPRGTKDWFGEEMVNRTRLEEIVREICVQFNIKEISTPVFEHTDLFLRGVGETTDVVQKEMYTFMDKGDRSITLKPEGTAGVVRSFLEQKMFNEVQPTKLFYITPAFRYEKPQAGRLRQHHQFGVEVFGAPGPLAEIEVITVLRTLFDRIGIQKAKLHINSIGCGTCRLDYNSALMAYLNQHKEGLCGTCKERMEKNPLRIIDCKVPGCKEIVKDAPRTIDYLDEDCQVHFNTLKKWLDALQIPYEVDTDIVRGLDYYTKTVFEFIDQDGMTICGGGRYDKLVQEIDGKIDMPAVGFGIGIERLLLALKKEDVILAKAPDIDLYVGILGEEVTAKAYEIVTHLRRSGLVIETDYLGKSVKAQMKYANKIGALKTIIIGENELKTNLVQVKDMETGETTEVKLSDILTWFTGEKA
ncbi:histidyl-tRNA synthetase [Petrocella atlantisensis]|uniref:Histidine--tRNA ligase n=1 Tax=Petrocella atlantisensis TaxID=2173034 RepID=A0A3P7P1A1_9FIRM|nr:histidine--tRNA ligase [Petrocella atlantisensis]VDN48935.1 histidyl-tRNA synthetase [Petrocella atlantisensis]